MALRDSLDEVGRSVALPLDADLCTELDLGGRERSAFCRRWWNGLGRIQKPSPARMVLCGVWWCAASD
jgi:hypothetical protein